MRMLDLASRPRSAALAMRVLPVRVGWIAAWCAIAAVDTARLDAQTVVGTVVDAGSGMPVSQAVVVLVDAGDRRVAAALSGGDGSFTLRAATPGSYRVRAERVGYASTLSPALALAEGQTVQQRVAAQVRQVSLAPIVVSGRRGACSMQEDGGQTAAVWDEARKVLASVALAGESGAHEYHTRRYRQQMARSGREMLPALVSETRVTSSEPFHAVPVDRLVSVGWVEEVGDSLAFHAPDAATLLSTAFVDHHCFALVENAAEHPGELGLAFEPVRGATRPDVAGTLWVDRASAELRTAEYAYVNLHFRGRTAGIGGRLAFERLDDGGWMVRLWRVRMPVLAVGTHMASVMEADSVSRVVGIAEQGGEVLQVRAADGTLVWAGALTRVAQARADGSFPRDTGHIILLRAIHAVAEANGRVPELEAAGFYQRRSMGFGDFVDRATIERRNPGQLTDLLAGVHGVREVNVFGYRDVALVGAPHLSGRLCLPEVVVDGVSVRPSGLPSPSGLTMNELAFPTDVEAVEIHPLALNVPAEWGGNRASCGVIAIWTRHGRGRDESHARPAAARGRPRPPSPAPPDSTSAAQGRPASPAPPA
jgi:hypothetical protein